MAGKHTETPRGNGSSELMPVMGEILKAVGDLRSEFTGKLNSIVKASEDTAKQLSDCANSIKQAAIRISVVEDDLCELKDMVEKMEKRNRVLEEKVIDMETRSRLNNIRLVNLPEGAENPDLCAFLEGWLPDTLGVQMRRLSCWKGYTVLGQKEARGTLQGP